MHELYLPLGSIVMLSGGDKKIMIYGRRQQHVLSGRVFDYVACLYPEGNLDDEHTYLFDHADINEVVFIGFEDEEDITYTQALKEMDEPQD